jgi:flagella basal body P-ring formation protein FlgA
VSAALSVLLLLGAEAIALREKATVNGRWVRVVDLLDPDLTDPNTRARVAEIYVGRAPEEGRTRTITAAEIRRELESRGMDLSSVVWTGSSVEITRGNAAPADALRAALAAAIQKLEGAATVTILTLQPDACPEGCRVAEVQSNGEGYVATLTNGTKVDVVARVLKIREQVIASRDLPPGRVLEPADLEVRKIEASDADRLVESGLVVGSTSTSKIRAGSPITAAQLRLKPAIRKGDVVRAFSSGYEVDVRALEDGSAGQEINLEFIASGNRVRGKVVNASRVDVGEAGR